MRWLRVWRFWLATLALLAACLCSIQVATPDGAGDSVQQSLLEALDQARRASGLAPLMVDPRLTEVAAARAQYVVDHGQFSHCTGVDGDPQCSQSGYDFVAREQAAGIRVNQPGTVLYENLAYFNDLTGSTGDAVGRGWLNSPEHRAAIMDGHVAYTGFGMACCFSGVIGGRAIRSSDGVYVVVQEFSGGPGAVPADGAGQTGRCQFVLGFAVLAQLIAPQVGHCTDDEQHNPVTGDALQHTSTGGLLVWRRADNWTAFTDGYRTWVSGPYGLKERLNDQRFSWEANPTGLPLVASSAPGLP